MYCKKCGRKQEEGQKFCPKCGEPFLEVRQNANNEFDNNVEGTVDRAKEANWNEKKEEASSFIKEFINNPKKIGIATKTIVSLFAFWFVTKNGFSASPIWYIIITAMLFIAFMGLSGNKFNKLHSVYALAAICLGSMFIVTFGSSKSEGELLNKSPQEEFLKTIDRPETSYMAAVPERFESRTFEWTLIFFPKNHEKTLGNAMMEPWYIGENSWANGRKRRYEYEIHDNHIELFNGKGIFLGKWCNYEDLRFTIEERDSRLQLRGMFAGEERIFRLNPYKDKSNKEKHNEY